MGHRSIPSKVFVVLSGRVGITHEPIHCVARGDGGYKLQSKVHCLFRITYLLCTVLSPNAVDSTDCSPLIDLLSASPSLIVYLLGG